MLLFFFPNVCIGDQYSFKCSDIIDGFITFTKYKGQFCNTVPSISLFKVPKWRIPSCLQWRIQRGFLGFKRTPSWALIISFSWRISGKIGQTAQIEPPSANLNPRSKNPGSAPGLCTQLHSNYGKKQPPFVCKQIRGLTELGVYHVIILAGIISYIIYFIFTFDFYLSFFNNFFKHKNDK